MKKKTTPKTPVHVFEPFPNFPWEFKVYSGFFKIRRMFSNPFRVLALILIVMSPYVLYYLEVNYQKEILFFTIEDIFTATVISLIITGTLFFLYLFEFIMSTQSRQDMILYLKYKLERTGEIERMILSSERYKETQAEQLKLNAINRNSYQEFLDDLIHYERYKKRQKEGARALQALRMEKVSEKKREEVPLGV